MGEAVCFAFPSLSCPNVIPASRRVRTRVDFARVPCHASRRLAGTERGLAVPTVSLADRAYLALREEILRGQLRPGTPLSRRRLAREPRMSVVPVTEALQRLEGDGLVETRAQIGRASCRERG